jgi:hypothetical protein
LAASLVMPSAQFPHWGFCTLALVGALGLAGARAEDAKYPDLNGQWSRAAQGANWDPTKPGGLRQGAPLTPEYQALLESSIAATASGGEGYNLHSRCISAGMPRTMLAYEPLDFILTPQATYIRDYFNDIRRIHTDGRGWPATVEPTFNGYTIGEWKDEGGSGRYDVLVAETRFLKGPRVFDASGIPMHMDNQTVIKERIWLDKANPDRLYDEITTFDHALTRPWTVLRPYAREHEPIYAEFVCAEDNHHIMVGNETYFRSVDGLLMPTRKDQPPPPLRGFDQTAK